MIRKKNDPPPAGTVIQDGLRVRTLREVWWMHEGQEIRIPAGTRGVIGFWLPFEKGQSSLGKGCSILFEGYRHPAFHGFPSSRRDIGWDVLPECMEAINPQERTAA